MSYEDRKKTGGAISSGMTYPAAHGIAPPPPHPGLSQFTGSMFTRPTVHGLYYNNKVIPLDGYDFDGCRFDNCTMIATSTNFSLRNCVIDPATRIQYGIETMRIVQLFNSRNEWYYQHLPGLAPVKNVDGTINIAGMPI